MIDLIRNEVLKLLRRRRFTIAVVILAVILSAVTYGQYRQLQSAKDGDWRARTQQTIVRYQNAMRRAQANPTWARSLRLEIARLQYYLDRDIQPDKPNAPYIVRAFANIAGFLLLPLLVSVLASDVVSAEHAEGTDKLLLTHPVRRWRILTSKLAAVFLFTTLLLLCGALLGFTISSFALESRGWGAPTFSGFRLTGETVDFAAVRQLPLWQDTLIAYGLEWYALLMVASIAVMLSTIFRSSAASIGTMMAALIGGTILTRLTPDWIAGKYFFVSALPLADYYTGQPPPYEGMPLLFCISLLAVWAAAALIVAYGLFTRRDVFG
ncbi:MAG: ABC transporter permease [Acidobacteria bacterium]|nr:ABC transporter permease [Acidobacteriota bacterium]